MKLTQVHVISKQWQWHRLPMPLRLYAGILLALWVISALPLLLHSSHLWPASLLWPPPPFWDFGCYYHHFQHLHTPQFWTMTGPSWDYPAPCALVYRLFYAFNRGVDGPHPVRFGMIAYFLFAGLILITAGQLLGRAIHRKGFAWVSIVPFLMISIPLCWPVYFGLQRGNIEFFLDTGIALAVWAYARKRWWLAALLLGVFGAGKLYPLLLLSLFLPLRRWKEFFAGLAAAAATSLYAAHWLGAPPATSGHARGIASGIYDWIQSNSLTIDLRNIGYDHSILGFLKTVVHNHPQWFTPLAITYASLGSVGMLVLFFTRIVRLPRPNQLLAVSLATVLLPPTSFDYTLSLLLPAWAWLVVLAAQSHRNALSMKHLSLCLAAFAMVFAPETFLCWHGVFYAGQFKMLCLLLLFLAALLFPLAEEAPQ